MKLQEFLVELNNQNDWMIINILLRWSLQKILMKHLIEAGSKMFIRELWVGGCFMLYSSSLIKFLIMKVAENEND